MYLVRPEHHLYPAPFQIDLEVMMLGFGDSSNAINKAKGILEVRKFELFFEMALVCDPPAMPKPSQQRAGTNLTQRERATRTWNTSFVGKFFCLMYSRHTVTSIFIYKSVLLPHVNIRKKGVWCFVKFCCDFC